MLRLEIGESGREQQQEQRSGGEGSPALEREGSGASFERAASASASDGAYCSVLNVVFVLPPSAVPQLGSCTSSGRVCWPRAARHSQGGPQLLWDPSPGLRCSSEPH